VALQHLLPINHQHLLPSLVVFAPLTTTSSNSNNPNKTATTAATTATQSNKKYQKWNHSYQIVS
jgi:hypothetical protein